MRKPTVELGAVVRKGGRVWSGETISKGPQGDCTPSEEGNAGEGGRHFSGKPASGGLGD